MHGGSGPRQKLWRSRWPYLGNELQDYGEQQKLTLKGSETRRGDRRHQLRKARKPHDLISRTYLWTSPALLCAQEHSAPSSGCNGPYPTFKRMLELPLSELNELCHGPVRDQAPRAQSNGVNLAGERHAVYNNTAIVITGPQSGRGVLQAFSSVEIWPSILVRCEKWCRLRICFVEETLSIWAFPIR